MNKVTCLYFNNNKTKSVTETVDSLYMTYRIFLGYVFVKFLVFFVLFCFVLVWQLIINYLRTKKRLE